MKDEFDPNARKQIITMDDYYSSRLMSEISTLAFLSTRWMTDNKLRVAVINSIFDCTMEYLDSGFRIANYEFAKGDNENDEQVRSMLLDDTEEDIEHDSLSSDEIDIDLMLRRYFRNKKKEDNDDE